MSGGQAENLLERLPMHMCALDRLDSATGLALEIAFDAAERDARQGVRPCRLAEHRP